MSTRRTFFSGIGSLLTAGVAVFRAPRVMAQQPAPTVLEIREGEFGVAEGDTAFCVINVPFPQFFAVGVRTSVRADKALVEVFYDEEHPEFGTLLRSKESEAPVAGPDAYGATRDNFLIPRDKIRRIKVSFLNEVAARHVEVKSLKRNARSIVPVCPQVRRFPWIFALLSQRAGRL